MRDGTPWYKQSDEQQKAAVTALLALIAIAAGLASYIWGLTATKILFIVSLAGCLATGAWLFWHLRQGRLAAVYSSAVLVIAASGLSLLMFWPKHQPQVPTLAMLFASESKPLDGFIVGGAIPVKIAPGPRPKTEIDLLVWFMVSYDLRNNTRFVAFYVPHSDHAVTAIKTIALEYRNILKASDRWGSGRLKFGRSEPRETRKTVFNGQVFIYHEDLLGPLEEDDIVAGFRNHGADATLRGTDYLASRYEAIKAGDATPFPIFTNPPSQTVDCSHFGFAYANPAFKSGMVICRRPMKFTIPNPSRR